VELELDVELGAGVGKGVVKSPLRLTTSRLLCLTARPLNVHQLDRTTIKSPKEIISNLRLEITSRALAEVLNKERNSNNKITKLFLENFVLRKFTNIIF
jgi:hypothetical protein